MVMLVKTTGRDPLLHAFPSCATNARAKRQGDGKSHEEERDPETTDQNAY